MLLFAFVSKQIFNKDHQCLLQKAANLLREHILKHPGTKYQQQKSTQSLHVLLEP